MWGCRSSSVRSVTCFKMASRSRNVSALACWSLGASSRLLLYPTSTASCGSMDHCAARAGAPTSSAASAASARPTGACDARACAPVIRRRTALSRHHHSVAALQQHVLGQVLAALHLSVAEAESLDAAIMTAQDDDIVAGRVRGGATREAQRLHDIDRAREGELPGVIHLAEHVDAIATDGLDRHRHDGTGQVALQAFCDRQARGLHRHTGGCDLAREREAQATIWPDQHLTLQVRLLPHRHVDDVAG